MRNINIVLRSDNLFVCKQRLGQGGQGSWATSTPGPGDCRSGDWKHIISDWCSQLVREAGALLPMSVTSRPTELSISKGNTCNQRLRHRRHPRWRGHHISVVKSTTRLSSGGSTSQDISKLTKYSYSYPVIYPQNVTSCVICCQDCENWLRQTLGPFSSHLVCVSVGVESSLLKVWRDDL